METLTQTFKEQDISAQRVAVDIGLLALRVTAGGLMAGHGAQKLFGSFGGHGIEGTAGSLESMGLKPSTQWAAVAGASEFGSGVLTALGLLHPLGPIAMFGPMLMAWNTAHAGKPIWVTSGGAELPLMYLNNAAALLFTGPGRFALDKAFGIKVPAFLAALTAVGVAAGVAAGLLGREQPSEAPEPAGSSHEAAPAAQPLEEQFETTDDVEEFEELQVREVGGV
jgi:putative oxidoreductase